MAVRHRGRAWALALAVPLLSAVVAAPATAAQLRTNDAVGDVWRLVYDDNDVLTGYRPAGSVSNGDVVSTVARHTERRISFTTQYATLLRGPGKNGFISVHRMRFDNDVQAAVNMHATYGDWSGQSFLTNERTGNALRCAGVRHGIDYQADTVRVSLPRACVDQPRWLTYTGLHYTLAGGETQTGADDHAYLDNALNSSHRTGTGPANSSARIHSG